METTATVMSHMTMTDRRSHHLYLKWVKKLGTLRLPNTMITMDTLTNTPVKSPIMATIMEAEIIMMPRRTDITIATTLIQTTIIIPQDQKRWMLIFKSVLSKKLILIKNT